MRITYLHQYFNTPSMSGSTRSFEMARRLVAAGHEVDLVTSWREATDKKSWFVTAESGIRVHWLPVAYSNHLGYAARIRAFFEFAVRASKYAAALPGDVVFASSTPLTIAIPGAYAARRRNVPMVFEVRDLWPELPIAVGALKNPIAKWLARRLELFAYQKASFIVALSQGMKDGVVEKGYPEDRIAVIPNGADLDAARLDESEARSTIRAELGVSLDATLILYTGTFGKINGVGYLARLAAKTIADPNIVFLLVGDGQEFDSVLSEARSLGCLGKNFFVRKKVPKRDVARITAACDIAVSTVIPLRELEANCANKFFDALAAGRCVAINHGGWQEDTLVAHRAGFRLPLDLDLAASILREWVSLPGRIAEAGRNARSLGERMFSRDSLAAELERVLSVVVNRKLAPRPLLRLTVVDPSSLANVNRDIK